MLDLFRASWKYALIAGIFLIILYHMSSYFGINPLINIGHLLFDIIIFGLFIFFASKEYKMTQTHGIFHFWQGMTIGFTVYIIGTAIFSIALMLFFMFDEQALINYQETATNFLNSRASIYKEQFGEENFAQQLLEIQNVTTQALVVSSIIKKLLAGFFITPVISIILRRQPN